MVNVQIEHLENHTARLTVSVEPERLEKAMRQAARRISQKSRIPGFRPGKAPYEIVLNLFGREYVLEEALESLGNEIYREALEIAAIEPYAPGNLVEIRDDGHTLVFVVAKAPTVELGDYHGIRVETEEPEVSDEQVNEAMEWLRQNQALVEPVERPAEVGDEVILEHLVVHLVKDEQATETPAAETERDEGAPQGVPETQASEEGEDEDDNVILHEHDYRVVLFDDQRDLYPGFTAQIVGLSAGDEKEFTLTIPADYDDAEVAGKTVQVAVKVGQVNARTVPEWSDELAKRISEGKFETMLELRMDLRRSMQEYAADRAKGAVFSKALSELVERATFQISEETIQDALSDLLEEFEAERLRPEGLTLKDYLTVTGRTEDDLRQILRPAALDRLKSSLAFHEFMRREQVRVSGEEVEAEIDRLSGQFGEHAQAFRRLLATDKSRSAIASDLLIDRATRRLVAIASGKGDEPEAAAAPAEETAAETGAASVEEGAVSESQAAVETSLAGEQGESAGNTSDEN